MQYLSTVHIFISFKFTFMRTHKKLQIMFLQDAVCDVWTKVTAPSSKSVWFTTREGFGVTPQQIQHLQVKTIISSFAQQGTAEIETKLKECHRSENTLKVYGGQQFQHNFISRGWSNLTKTWSQ